MNDRLETELKLTLGRAYQQWKKNNLAKEVFQSLLEKYPNTMGALQVGILI
jgi:TolA-binding protein